MVSMAAFKAIKILLLQVLSRGMTSSCDFDAPLFGMRSRKTETNVTFVEIGGAVSVSVSWVVPDDFYAMTMDACPLAFHHSIPVEQSTD